jgi:hypothetical protein
VYVIWDSDKDDEKPEPQHNHRLLRLLGQKIVDWPSDVGDTFACFESNMETTLQQELGRDEFGKWLKECQQDYCIPKKTSDLTVS